MFIFFMVIALVVLIALIIYMMIELNTIEQDGIDQIQRMKIRYGEEEL